MIAKHIDRFLLLKLDQVIDWQPIEQYLNRQRTRYLRDHRGRPAYPLLSMFKAVLLGQWHSLSDPELEHSLITRIDFNLFCRFDELSIPDYSTLCRYRNWLAQDDTLSELLELINQQLAEKNLKVEKASAAVVDATIIQTAGSKQRQAIEVDEEGQVSGQTTPSKSVFIVFVAGLPRKPKLPFADWYSTYARSFSKAACSFPTRKSCALLPIASAILQNGAIRFVWQSLPPHQSTPVPTKQMPYPCNHRQQGFFVSHQDYPAHVPMPPGSLFYP